jgi:serine/threonine-protein kinase
MGVVYLARDVDLHRDVAIKVLRVVGPAEGSGGDAGVLRDRFLREARSAARLSHPNVVTIYQVGVQGDVTFIAMEWVDGGSLIDHLRQNVFLDWREATEAIRDAAAGLAAAHGVGIVHRDLKPSNLMRVAGSGVVKLVDFGLARMADVASDLTHAGSILGTPVYLSPEQCRGEVGTERSDIYGLTCTYFQLLTSRTPFAAENLAALLYQHQNEPFPDARRMYSRSWWTNRW